MAYALQARVVFLVDRPPIEHGIVTIDGERIVAVGTKAEAGEIIDLGQVALIPGLVNCHTHLEFSYLQRPLGKPGMRLVDWIRLVIAERGRSDYAPAAAIGNGLRESFEYGVTSVGDITVIELPAYIAAKIGLNLYTEVIGFSLARAHSALSALNSRLFMHDAMSNHGEHWIDDIQFGISPHAPYTVSPRLLEDLVSVACHRNMPLAMHLAESAEELELLQSGTGPFQELLDERSMWDAETIPRGCRPLDYLRMLAEAPRSLVIHGNYLDRDEHQFLAANTDRMSLVFCPRTHNYFQHPPYPLEALSKKGVRVALGTDSRASNPDLNLFSEMSYIAKMSPTIDPHEVLRMGTLAGAEALGRDAELGSITQGKLANLVAFPLAEETSGKANEMLDELFASDQVPCGIWLRGAEFTS